MSSSQLSHLLHQDTALSHSTQWVSQAAKTYTSSLTSSHSMLSQDSLSMLNHSTLSPNTHSQASNLCTPNQASLNMRSPSTHSPFKATHLCLLRQPSLLLPTTKRHLAVSDHDKFSLNPPHHGLALNLCLFSKEQSSILCTCLNI